MHPIVHDVHVMARRVAHLVRAEVHAWRDAQTLERDAERRFVELVQRVWETHPVYRQRWQAAGVTSARDVRGFGDLHKLPTVDKAFMRACGPLGPLRPGADPSKMRVEYSSGSSGEPMGTATPDATYDWYLAVQYRVYSMMGCLPWDTIAYVKPYGADTGSYFGLFEARHVDGKLGPGAMFDAIAATGARILACYPSHALPLIERVPHAKLQGLGLKAVSLNSEMSMESERARIQAAFGCPVQDDYGTTETWMIAASCPEGNRHIFTDNVWLEVVDDDGRPCPPGVAGRGVVTNLVNPDTPIIRYALGDTLALAADPCPCGRGFPVLAAINGRREDSLVRPDGSRVGFGQLIDAITAWELHDRAIAHVSAWRIVQDQADAVTVLVVPNGAWEQRAADALARRVGAVMGPSVQVAATRAEALPPTGGTKRRTIQCNVPR